jgi:3,4-dihydroxy 2-butanone 4-phosphate synthase/GTP cyclohydrolase II
MGARGRGAGARARAAVGAGRAGRAARHAQLGLHEALARIRQEGCGVAVLLNCGESAEQLLAQFQGTARATHAPARAHGPAQLRHRRADPARAGRAAHAPAGHAARLPSLAGGFGLEVAGYITKD